VAHDPLIPSHIKSVNRAKLGQVAFKDERSHAALRSIVSPGIKKLMLEKFSEIEYKKSTGVPGFEDYHLVAVEGAGLIEAGTSRFFDEIWVTTLDREAAFRRI